MMNEETKSIVFENSLKSQDDNLEKDTESDKKAFERKILEQLFEDKKKIEEEIRKKKEELGIKRIRRKRLDSETVVEKEVEKEVDFEKQMRMKEILSKAFSKFCILPLEIICKRIDPDEPLTADEKQEFIEATELLAEKYAEWTLTYSVEINFVFVLTSIIGLRIYHRIEKEKLKELENK